MGKNVYFDESGIHKVTDNSTFVLVYVETTNVAKLERQIVELETELKIETFHWSETAKVVKEKFLTKALKFDFGAKIAVVNNPVDPVAEMNRLLPHMLVEKDIYKLVIDGEKPKWYERLIKNVLRAKGITVKKLKTVRQESEPVIRLADMVAGLARSYFDQKSEVRFSKYYLKLRPKIEVLLQ